LSQCKAVRPLPEWSFKASFKPHMDLTRCDALKMDFQRQPQPWIVSAERFFDGNDDANSIGWYVTPYPGIDTFRDLLMGLLQRSDVEAVYARLVELDLNEDVWPSTDLFFVVGTISPDELQKILSPLMPIEVCPVKFAVPEIIKRRHHAPVVAARWG
jgi:hypothetical protein